MSKILFLPRENKIHIFKSPCNVLLLYRHANDVVFDDFPKISEDFQNCSEGQTKVSEHFPRISEDVRRFPMIAQDFRGRPEDVSMIHQRI